MPFSPTPNHQLGFQLGASTQAPPTSTGFQLSHGSQIGGVQTVNASSATMKCDEQMKKKNDKNAKKHCRQGIFTLNWFFCFENLVENTLRHVIFHFETGFL